jgi:hypothetical protein
MRRANLNLSINTNFDIPQNINDCSPKTPLIDSSPSTGINSNTGEEKIQKKIDFQGKKIHQDYNTSGELWLGDYEDSCYAYQNGINVVINVAHECDTPLISNNYRIYIHYRLKDNSHQDTSIIMKEIPNKLHTLVSEGNKILLHCRKGISRSVSCIMAYLIRYNNLKYEEAYQHMLSIKKNISPNFAFLDALENLR